MTRTRKILFLTIGLTVSTFTGFVVLELLFGAWLSDDVWKQTHALNIIRNSRIVYNVERIYGKGAPEVVYTRDSFGLRGACQDPKDIQILTIGGSTTDQRYIRDGQTFQDILQGHLEKRLGKSYCVSNAGVDGHSTYGHIVAMERWFPHIPRLRPNYFLLYIGINDAVFRDAPQESYDLPHGQDGRATNGLSALRRVMSEKSAIYGSLRMLRNIFVEVAAPPENAGHFRHPVAREDYVATTASPFLAHYVGNNTLAFKKRLGILLDKTRDFGAKPICVSQPHLFAFRQGKTRKGVRLAFSFDGREFNGLDYDDSISALNEVMREYCVDAGGHYIDAAAGPFTFSDFYDPMHMTPEGASKLGLFLFHEFERQGIPAEL